MLKTDLYRAGQSLLELARESDGLTRMMVAQRLLGLADRLNRLAIETITRELERVSG